VTSNQKQKCSFHLDFGISLAIHLLIANIFLDCHHAKFQVLLISFVCDFATTKSEIAKAIAQVKANKSPGVDCISKSVTSNQKQKCSFHLDFGISLAIHLLIANMFLDCHHAKFQVLLISFV
jgi:hypothetical protein